MSLPGMRERTLRIGSAGKTFSLTGWKVGYVTAAPRLLEPVAKAHQFTTFTTPPGLQKAVAYGLGKDDAYYRSLAGDLEVKRDRFAAGLARVGFGVVPVRGHLLHHRRHRAARPRRRRCRALPADHHGGRRHRHPRLRLLRGRAAGSFVRFCFSKRDAVLDGALDRLGRWIENRNRAIA